MSPATKKQKVHHNEELFTSLTVDGIQVTEEDLQKARDNDGIVLYNIGINYYSKKNYTKALPWLRRAGDVNNSNAQEKLGYMYRSGCGASVDYNAAMDWYLKAADNGNELAQSNIGFLYHSGLGFPKDIHKAIEWFTKSAMQGNAVAQNNLAAIYENEKEVKDLSKATTWYKKAIDTEYESALKKLNERIRDRETKEKEKLKKSKEKNQSEGDKSNEAIVNPNEDMLKKLEDGFQLKLDQLEQEKRKLIEEKDQEIIKLKVDFEYYKGVLGDKMKNSI